MPPNDPQTIAQVVRLKRAGLSWREIGDACGMTRTRARAIYLHNGDKPEYAATDAPHDRANLEPACTVDGVRPAELWPDESSVLQKAIADFANLRTIETRRLRQAITFSHGPAAVLFGADIHLGARGCNVERAFGEAEVIASIPGSCFVFAGDGRDSFVIGKLMRLLMDQSLSIEEEIVLFKAYLRIVAARLKLVVSGNHDEWAQTLTGVPYLREVSDMICPEAIYADYGTPLTVRVGETEFPGMVRHSWGTGSSIYNETHPIEAAFQRKYQWLQWGVGAHTHRGGAARSSNIGGVQRLAVMCGTYKEYDSLGQRLALAPPGNSAAVGIVFHEDGSMTGFDQLAPLARYMDKMYRP